MLINYTGKNIQVTDNMREMVESQLSKLDKFFDEEVRCNVTLSEFKQNKIVEVNIDLPGNFIRAEESDPELRTALDRVTDVLTRQVRRHKGKLQKKYRGKKGIRLENIPDFEYQEFEQTEEEDKIIKTKTYTTRPMDEEEAILQMELIGHNFFAFNNAETNEVNVLYKRKNGGYGILTPEE